MSRWAWRAGAALVQGGGWALRVSAPSNLCPPASPPHPVSFSVFMEETEAAMVFRLGRDQEYSSPPRFPTGQHRKRVRPRSWQDASSAQPGPGAKGQRCSGRGGCRHSCQLEGGEWVLSVPVTLVVTLVPVTGRSGCQRGPSGHRLAPRALPISRMPAAGRAGGLLLYCFQSALLFSDYQSHTYSDKDL